MDLAELEGKRIALVITDEQDESVAFTGTAHWDGGRLVMLGTNPTPRSRYNKNGTTKFERLRQAIKMLYLEPNSS
jgi:hypothetical protein